MAGRGFSGSYRFGYQGSEKDNEVSGEGNSYTTEFRQLDPRLGRWFSVDPVFQPWQSPYTSMDNNPICLNDPMGLDPKKDKNGKTSNDDKKTDGPSKIKEVFTRAYRYLENRFYHYTGQQYKNDAYAFADKHGISRDNVKFGRNSETGRRYAKVVTGKKGMKGGYFLDGSLVTDEVVSNQFFYSSTKGSNSSSKSANNRRGFLSPVGDGLKWLDKVFGGKGGTQLYSSAYEKYSMKGYARGSDRKGDNDKTNMTNIDGLDDLFGGAKSGFDAEAIMEGTKLLFVMGKALGFVQTMTSFGKDINGAINTAMSETGESAEESKEVQSKEYIHSLHWSKGPTMAPNGKSYNYGDTIGTERTFNNGKKDTIYK